MDKAQKVKLVVVGDGTVGKKCMFHTFVCNAFPGEYVPQINDVLSKWIEVDGMWVDLALWYTPGQDDYARLRPLSYHQTDVFLVAYSVDWPPSYSNVEIKWVPELQQHTSGVPFILVGTKTDLREDEGTLARLSQEGKGPLTIEDGEKLAAELGAVKYMECSALKQKGLKEVFEEAVRVVLTRNAASKSRKHTCIMI